MKGLIGVDIGTQGTKAAVFAEGGECVGQAFVGSQLHRPRPGVFEEDPERQFESVCQTIRRCLRQAKLGPGDVAGIGIDGQMAGIIGIGGDGRAVTPYDSWLDTRCAGQIRQMEQEGGEEVLAKTGCAPSFNHGPKVLWWMQECPRIYRKIASFVQPGGYAAMRLCGLDAKEAFIDATYLHFSGFADNLSSSWDEGLCRRFGMDIAKLPRIVRPEAVVGEVPGSIARRCGLKAGVPVVAGCGDTAASFLSCGAVREGVGVDVAGTAAVFAATTSEFRADVHHRMIGCGQSAVPGLWHPYAYINGAGMNLEWFRRELARHAGVNGRKPVDYEQLNRAAQHVAAEEHLPLFVPHMGGRVCPSQPELRGAWLGLCWDHTAAQLYRAMLESVALEYAAYKRVLLGMYPDFRLRELRITGGGEKSGLWNQIKADVLQTAVLQIAHSEGAPRGAAMLAGWGVGLLTDLPSAARQWIKVGGTVRPRRASAGYYARRAERYEQALAALNELAEAGRSDAT